MNDEMNERKKGRKKEKKHNETKKRTKLLRSREQLRKGKKLFKIERTLFASTTKEYWFVPCGCDVFAQ